MNVLSRLRLRTKLGLLMAMSVLTVVAAIATAGSLVRARMMAERVDKLHAVVDAAIGIAQRLQQREAAGELTHAQTQAMLRDDIHAMRFENGTGYVSTQDPDGVIVMHGANPALEGQQSTAKDSQGRSLTDLIRTLRSQGDSGTIPYVFNKPGEAAAQPKIAFVRHFAPWNVVFFSGVYVDDLDVALRATVLHLSLVSGVIVTVMMLVAWAINRDITGSLARLAAAMGKLAAGDLDTAIAGPERGDEVGAMAKIVLVFKTHMLQTRQLEAERDVARQKGEQDKRLALVKMANRIESETNEALRQVGARTEGMAATADQMHASATRTGFAAGTAAEAAGQALANAQSVAGAAEQLAASIGEISAKVGESTAMVTQAVSAGLQTRQTIEALNERVGQIGAVADMIGEIAAKTNLLALNATIEAARAGEAGKGFAVVASEVKGLATQTARSTQDISRHIHQVRAATGAAVAAVGQIEETINAVNTIAGWIASAVEQQGAATARIAQNVVQTAAAADQMTVRVSEVSAEALETGRHSTDVHDNATALAAAMKDLKQGLVRVVRSATAGVDRRADFRHSVQMDCRLAIAGQPPTPARISDLSRSGARISDGPALTVGAEGTLRLDTLPVPLPFTVRSSDSSATGVMFKLDAAAATALDTLLERLISQQAA